MQPTAPKNWVAVGRVGQSGKRCARRVRSRALHGVALAVPANLGNARNRPTRPTVLKLAPFGSVLNGTDLRRVWDAAYSPEKLGAVGRVGQSGKRCARRVRSRALHGVALAVPANFGNARNRPTRPTVLKLAPFVSVLNGTDLRRVWDAASSPDKSGGCWPCWPIWETLRRRVRSRALHGVALAVPANLGNARNRPTRPPAIKLAPFVSVLNGTDLRRVWDAASSPDKLGGCWPCWPIWETLR